MWNNILNSRTGAVTVEPGATYEHVTERGTTEIAYVVEVSTDALGIRHIRFILSYRFQHKTTEAGERMLAIAAFTSRFRHRAE
jgi:hypothetical protein